MLIGWSRTVALIVAAYGLTFSAAAFAQAAPDLAREVAGEPTLAQRLAWIEERLEEARVEQHVPGMGLAIVKDGKVVLLRGFGLAEVESGREVTPDTRFAVGSTTKAFTATLIGMLNDEGEMSFDEPVRTHLPQFKVNHAEIDGKVTIRDLLSHRAGFAVMNGLWYGLNDITREEILEAMSTAEPLFGLGEQWNYSNESFLAAGMAAGNAAGSDWDTALRERIFEPLGMHDSNTTYATAQADDQMSRGYRWDAKKEVLEEQPMRRADAIGPAGSINSSARDMARWVLFQLGRGVIDGQRLLSESTHAETWTPQIEMGRDIDYGLGWMIREWEGRRVIEHAGGIDGFTAEVAMLPEENIGFVLLMNLFASPLQETSRSIIFRGLVGDIADAGPTEEDFGEYTGSYIANFGSFKNAELKVLVQNGRLAVDVPGQMVFEMQPPDAEGRRAFRVSDAVKVKFNENDLGQVYSLTFFQSGMRFEAVRKGMQVPVEIDLAEAQEYLGAYRLGDPELTVTVVVQNNRLAIDHPGQMVYELTPPDEEGWSAFRAIDGIRVRFERDDEGNVVSMSHEQGGAVRMFERVGDATKTASLPTVDQIVGWLIEAGVIDTGGRLRTLEVSGTVNAVNMGLRGPVRGVYTSDGQHHVVTDFGRFGRSESVVRLNDGRSVTSATGVEDIEVDELDEARQGNPLTWTKDWRTAFESVRVTGERKFDDRDVVVMSMKMGEAGEATVFIDKETHLPLGYDSMMTSTLGPRLSTTTRLSDWREVAGVQIPCRSVVHISMAGKIVTQYDQVRGNVDVEPGEFDLPSGD